MSSMQKATMFAVALFGLSLGGCGFHNQEEQAEYDRVYGATREVIGKYFHVQESQFIEGHLISYSRISNQFGEQQRYKIDAWVDRDTEGFFTPRVQVLEEVNMSIVNAGKNSHAQNDAQWRSVGFNRKLSTQLTNEINDAIGGHSSAVNADYFDTDLGLIERQKKIDEARAGYQPQSGQQP